VDECKPLSGGFVVAGGYKSSSYRRRGGYGRHLLQDVEPAAGTAGVAAAGGVDSASGAAAGAVAAGGVLVEKAPKMDTSGQGLTLALTLVPI